MKSIEAAHQSQAATPIVDLKDDLGDLLSSPGRIAKAVEVFTEKCPKCGGTGKYPAPSTHGRTCFTCDGKGVLTFKSSPEQRAKSRAATAKRKEKKLADNLAVFEEKNPDIAAWWKDTDFEFALSLKEAVRQRGDLTAGQKEAAAKCIEKRKVALAEAEERKASAQEVSIESIEEAFGNAKASGLKNIKLRLAAFCFSPAPESGKNSGAIYVKEGDQYLGKIQGGKFIRVRECTPEQEAGVVAAASNPKESAEAYGKLTGSCSVCGRPLENRESIERGIGPICAGRFGWGS